MGSQHPGVAGRHVAVKSPRASLAGCTRRRSPAWFLPRVSVDQQATPVHRQPRAPGGDLAGAQPEWQTGLRSSHCYARDAMHRELEIKSGDRMIANSAEAELGIKEFDVSDFFGNAKPKAIPTVSVLGSCDYDR